MTRQEPIEVPYVALITGDSLREAVERPVREERLARSPEEAAAKSALDVIQSKSPERFRQPARPLSEWEDRCLTGMTATGTIRGGAGAAGVSRADVLLCYGSNAQFRTSCDNAMSDYADGLHQQADKMARGNDGPMLRFLLAGHMPDKFGRQQTQIVITVSDKKEIERLSRAAGVDPAKVIETTAQIIGQGKGQ